MKILLKNTNVTFVSKGDGPEEYRFSIPYADIENWNYAGDVNLIYQGDIHTGDKVYIIFDQNTDDTIVLFSKSKTNGNYDDNVGLSYMRWIGTTLHAGDTDIGPIEATEECSNIRLYFNDKDSTVVKTAGKVSGKVIIERA